MKSSVFVQRIKGFLLLLLTLKILLSLKVIETSVTEVTAIKKFITKKHKQVINKLLEKEEGD